MPSTVPEIESFMSDLSHLLNVIKEPVICHKCYDDFIEGRSDAASLQAFTVLDVGFTDRGIQIWCRRHDMNVCHIDFAGMSLDADFRCLEKKQPEH